MFEVLVNGRILLFVLANFEMCWRSGGTRGDYYMTGQPSYRKRGKTIDCPLTMTALSHMFNWGSPGTRLDLCCDTSCDITSMASLYSSLEDLFEEWLRSRWALKTSCINTVRQVPPKISSPNTPLTPRAPPPPKKNAPKSACFVFVVVKECLET